VTLPADREVGEETWPDVQFLGLPHMNKWMDVGEHEAFEILRDAFGVDPGKTLRDLKTQYNMWLLQGNHPDTGGTGKNFDRVRQAYHAYVNYSKPIQKESLVGGDPSNYQEFVADALANGNYCAASMANFSAFWGVPFEKFYREWKK
jgi:hypothetical protein